MKNIYLILLVFFGHTISLSGQGALSVIANHIQCPEIAAGSFSLTLSPSVLQEYDGPFSATWENLDTGDYEEFEFNGTWEFLAGLEAGNYEIIINLGENCTIEYTGEITSTTNIDLRLEGENPTFGNDCNDGSIDLKIDGGVAPYDIVWERLTSIVPLITEVVKVSNGVSGEDGQEDLDNARDGSYRVMVTDAMCDPVFSSTILNCECGEDCEVTGEITNANCGELGAINVEFICDGNMVPIQTYNWDDGSQSGTRENLMPGDYCVTITDEDGCESDQCFTVEEGGEENVTVSLLEIKNVSFCNVDEECGEVGCENDGAISISVNTTMDYTIEWIGPNGLQSNEEEIENLGVGLHIVDISFPDFPTCNLRKVYHISVCTEQFHVGIDECDVSIAGMIVNLDNKINVSNSMPCSGAIDISVDELGEPVSHFFSWEGPNGFTSNSEDIAGLCEGNYCVSINNGCSEEEDCFNIVNCDNAEIRIEGEVTNTCPNVNFGSIDIFVEGLQEFSYLWSNGETTQNLEELAIGNYTLTVTDEDGCREVAEFVVTSENNIEPSRRPDECTIYYSCNGMPAFQQNVEVSSCEYLEEDCVYEVCRCEDGYQLAERFVGSTFEILENTCQAIIYCLNGETYDIVDGDINYREVKMLDTDNVTNETVWYCCSYVDCVINEPNYNLNFNFTSHNENNLEFAIIQCDGDDGCSFEAFCGDDPEPFFQYCSIGIGECIQPIKGNCSDFDLSLFTQGYDKPYVMVNNKKFHKIDSPSGEIVWESESHQRKIALLEGRSENVKFKNITPNPFVDEIVLEFFAPEKEQVIYSIFNGAGMKILENKIILNSGSNFKTISLSDVEMNGLFFIQVQDEKGTIVFREKLVKHE